MNPELYFWPHMDTYIFNLSNESRCMINFMIQILGLYKQPKYPLRNKPSGLLSRSEL